VALVDHTAADPAPGTTGRIGPLIVGIGVNDQTRAQLGATQRIGLPGVESDQIGIEIDGGPAVSAYRKAGEIARMRSLRIGEAVTAIAGIEMGTSAGELRTVTTTRGMDMESVHSRGESDNLSVDVDAAGGRRRAR